MRIKLEEEFKAREHLHRIGIIRTYLMYKYIKGEENKKGAVFPMHILEEHAYEHANRIIQNIQGTEGYHHDGRNYVEFREIREDKDVDKLLDKIYNQEPVSRAEIRRYTKSLRPYIKEIYGV